MVFAAARQTDNRLQRRAVRLGFADHTPRGSVGQHAVWRRLQKLLVIVDDEGVFAERFAPQLRVGGLAGAARRDEQIRPAAGDHRRAVHQQHAAPEQIMRRQIVVGAQLRVAGAVVLRRQSAQCVVLAEFLPNQPLFTVGDAQRRAARFVCDKIHKGFCCKVCLRRDLKKLAGELNG